jgi:hypothetical protein
MTFDQPKTGLETISSRDAPDSKIVAGVVSAGDLAVNSLLKNTWSTISSCSKPEENGHVGNVHHVFQRAGSKRPACPSTLLANGQAGR